MIGNKIYFLKSVSSTNTLIKENLNNYKDGDIVCAKRQTDGRGRRNNSWMSNDGDLHFSFVVDNNRANYHLFDMILLVTNTICNVLSKYNIEAKIKYPNDIIINRKKIAGILIERKVNDSDIYIVGVGLNIITTDFSEINNVATSIKLETKETLSYLDVLDDFIKEYNQLQDCKSCTLYEDYLKKNVVLNKEVEIDNITYYVKNIDLEGKLVLNHNGKDISKHMNEITLKEFYSE